MRREIPHKHIIIMGLIHFLVLIITSIIIFKADVNSILIVLLIICITSSLFFVGSYFMYRFVFYRKYDDFESIARLNRILYELVHNTSKLSTREALYKEVLKKSIEAISNASKGCILLLDDHNVLRYQAVIGYDEEALKSTYLLLEQSFLYLESKGKVEHTVVINDPFEYDKKNVKTKNMEKILEASPYQIRTTLSTPIIINNKLHGMINVDSELRNAYNKQDIKAIEIFAHEVVNVIKLYDSIEHNQYLLNRDVLTGIYNRRYINLAISERLNKIRQDERFCLISFDLNNLKKANDLYGHECGDKLLIFFANCIKGFIKQEDLFARYGGDEFLLLLNALSKEEVEALIKRINDYLVNNPLEYQNEKLSVSFSYGVSSFPDDGKDIDTLITNADCKMYVNKREYHLLRNDLYQFTGCNDCQS